MPPNALAQAFTWTWSARGTPSIVPMTVSGRGIARSATMSMLPASRCGLRSSRTHVRMCPPSAPPPGGEGAEQQTSEPPVRGSVHAREEAGDRLNDRRVTRASLSQPGPRRMHGKLRAPERLVRLGVAPNQPHLAVFVPAAHAPGM